MSKHKVKCKCCGMMMVPKTIFSRGFYGGWGVWLGGGNPVSTYCPFCLSEGWDGVKLPVERTTGAKFLLAGQIAFTLLIINGLLAWGLTHYLAVDNSSFIYTAIEWMLVILGFAAYQKYKFTSK